MVASIIGTRQLYESYLERHANSNTSRRSNPGAARAAFVNHFRHRLGLCTKEGRNYTDRAGNRILRECPDEDARLQCEDFSIKELMESIVGHGLSSFLREPQVFANWRDQKFIVEQRHPNDPRALLEAVGVGADPSAFADINAWTAVNSGLLERRVLEQFQNPEFIGGVICPDEMTRIAEGQKVIGVGNIYQLPKERQPGQPHSRASLQERWVTLPRTQDWAEAIDVTFEAAWFDLTGQVLETAANVGKRVALAKEYRCIDAVIGVPANTGLSTGRNAFQYKGTAYALYNFGPTYTAPYPINAQTGNGLVGADWQVIQNSWLLLQRMLDPESNTRIMVNADTLIASLTGAITLDIITGARDVQRRTSGGTTQATAPTLTVQNTESNPAMIGGRFGVKRIITSPLLEQRMFDADGLNLTPAQAAQYFWQMEAGKAFKNMVNFPLTVENIGMPTSYEMIDRKIIQTTFVNERSVPSVWSPWNVCLNKN